jgi:hypothetical protein
MFNIACHSVLTMAILLGMKAVPLIDTPYQLFKILTVAITIKTKKNIVIYNK